MSVLHAGDVAGPSYESQHQAQYRRLAVALLLVTAPLAACGDSSPVAPSTATDDLTMSPVLVSVVDDVTGRLLADVPADSPVQTAFAALRSALAAHDTPAALRAVADARLALDFSQAAHSIDAADRDALALQLSVLQTQLAEAR